MPSGRGSFQPWPRWLGIGSTTRSSARSAVIEAHTMTTETPETSPSVAGSAERISPEDQAAIHATLQELRGLNAWDEKDDAWICVQAMLSSLVLGTANPDRVASATGLSRDKLRVWFKRLRENGVIVGRLAAVWHVNWFDSDGGCMALILDTMVATGQLARRVDSESEGT